MYYLTVILLDADINQLSVPLNGHSTLFIMCSLDPQSLHCFKPIEFIHVILISLPRRHSFGSSRNLCVTSQKNVCVGAVDSHESFHHKRARYYVPRLLATSFIFKQDVCLYEGLKGLACEYRRFPSSPAQSAFARKDVRVLTSKIIPY